MIAVTKYPWEKQLKEYGLSGLTVLEVSGLLASRGMTENSYEGWKAEIWNIEEAKVKYSPKDVFPTRPHLLPLFPYNNITVVL